MFDFSWSEFLLVIVIAVFVVGPKDIPKMLYLIGRGVRRMQYMRFALSTQFEDFMQKAEIEAMQDPNIPETDEAAFDDTHHIEDDHKGPQDD